MHFVESLTKSDFNEEWMLFHCDWVEFPNTLQYVDCTWYNLRESFVHAWTNMVRHRDNQTTNRCEGAHGKLKRHLESSQLPFDKVFIGMHNYIELQVTEIMREFEDSLQKLKHSHNIPVLRELIGRASHYAIDLILEEMKTCDMVGIDVESCLHLASNIYDLPALMNWSSIGWRVGQYYGGC